MGFFDRFKKSPPPPPEGATVPEGHEVTIYAATVEPGVALSPGGIVVANLGVASDDPDRELEVVLRDVEAAVGGAAAPAHLVNLHREMRIAELFGDTKLEIVRFRSPVSWVFHRGGVASMIAEPRRLQSLLRCMHRISVMEGAPIQQAVYLVDVPSPPIIPFVRLIYGLELPVKQPDDQDGSLTIHVEVKRPDGVSLCVLAGTSYPVDDPGDAYARTVNEEKDRAAAASNEDELRRLETEERAALVERVGEARGTAAIVLRAPRLGQLILALQESANDGDAALAALVTELLARNAPLFFMKNPDNDGMEVRKYGPAGSALPIFSDLRSLEWAAADLGKEPGSYVTAAIHPRALIAMAAGGGMGLAIGTFRDRKTPVYAILSGPMVQAIGAKGAEGEKGEKG